jgi:uncharacterized Fe-S cluster-containing radical SAM superfamily protein
MSDYMNESCKVNIRDNNQCYPGCLINGSVLFDPIDLSNKVELKVCMGNRRRYSRFGFTLNYGTGVATGYSVGCNLRCMFCWAGESRDKLEDTYRYYSPQEAFEKMEEVAKRKNLNQIRISDCETTIGKTHLFELLELTEKSKFRRFCLETNGILLGYDRFYTKILSHFRKLYVRVSLKAGTAEDFARKTGAVKDAFELPFQAIRNLISEGIDYSVSAMSADPRFMSPYERVSLIGKLSEIDPNLVFNMEEEMVILFPNTLKRMKAYGYHQNNRKSNILMKMPILNKFYQVSYAPINSLGRKKISCRFSFHAIKEIIHGT